MLGNVPFFRQKLGSEVPLTTIQACDTNENISSHLQTIKKTSRRREMSVARHSFETEVDQDESQNLPQQVPTEI